MVLRVTVRAQHLAFLDLELDTHQAPAGFDRVRNTDLFRIGIGVMELDARRMILTATSTHEIALELRIPFGKSSPARSTVYAPTLYLIGASFGSLVPGAPRRPSPYGISSWHGCNGGAGNGVAQETRLDHPGCSPRGARHRDRSRGSGDSLQEGGDVPDGSSLDQRGRTSSRTCCAAGDAVAPQRRRAARSRSTRMARPEP